MNMNQEVTYLAIFRRRNLKAVSAMLLLLRASSRLEVAGLTHVIDLLGKPRNNVNHQEGSYDPYCWGIPRVSICPVHPQRVHIPSIRGFKFLTVAKIQCLSWVLAPERRVWIWWDCRVQSGRYLWAAPWALTDPATVATFANSRLVGWVRSGQKSHPGNNSQPITVSQYCNCNCLLPSITILYVFIYTYIYINMCV